MSTNGNNHGEETLMRACLLGSGVIEQLTIVAVALADGRRDEVDQLAQLQPGSDAWQAKIEQLAQRPDDAMMGEI